MLQHKRVSRSGQKDAPLLRQHRGDIDRAPTSSLRRRRSRYGARDSRAVPIFSPELRRRKDGACPKPGRPPETDCYLKIPGRVCGSGSGPAPSFFRRRPNGGRRCRSRRHRRDSCGAPRRRREACRPSRRPAPESGRICCRLLLPEIPAQCRAFSSAPRTEKPSTATEPDSTFSASSPTVSRLKVPFQTSFPSSETARPAPRRAKPRRSCRGACSNRWPSGRLRKSAAP